MLQWYKRLEDKIENDLGYVCVMHDEFYMQRAFELADLGLGSCSPNPLVGCVIVYSDQIIGEGWHREYGGPHAEVNAVASVNDLALLSQSTFYLTLEPCSYHGKTPACTDLILKHHPKRVVVASKDPNPLVSGNGIKVLEEAGIAVDYSLLENVAKKQNRRFFVNMKEKRPYVILKWAQTADGFIAHEDYSSKWITNTKSRQLVHKWRSEEDGILIGYNTAYYDNPSLDVREWHGRNPIKIVIDYELKLKRDIKLYKGANKTIVLNTIADKEEQKVIMKKFGKSSFLSDALNYLKQQEIGSIMVEGGAATLNQFIKAGLWDEARVFTSPKIFNAGIKAPIFAGKADQEHSILDDRLSIVYHPKTKSLWQKN